MTRHALFAFIILTQLDGSAVYVEANFIDVIRSHSKECGHGANAVVRIGATTLCVKESAQEIIDKIKK